VVRRQLFSLAAAGALIASLAAVAPASAAPPVQVTAGPPLGLVIPRDAHASGGHAGSSSNLLYHNGAIIPAASVTAIFWGTSWKLYTGVKMSGIDTFYTGFNGSHYAKTSDEYTGTNGQVVTSALTYNGHLRDVTAASGGGSTTAILNEVARVITTPVPNGYYPVYVDLPRGSAGYCGWHSWGTINGVLVQFAFFWNLDGDPGCNPQSTVTTDEGLAAIANTSAHELSEARTDPDGTGWYDRRGQENGDKCNWNFLDPYVTFNDGTEWKVQSEWSNNAGGCIDTAP
jgi:hypothetical protein